MATAIQTPSDTNNKVRFASTGRPRGGGGGDLRSSRQLPPSLSKTSNAMDSNSDVAAPSMYDTSTSESWSTSDGRTNPSSNYSSYNPSYSKASTSQQQQQRSRQQQQFQYQRTSNSSSHVDVNDTANTTTTSATTTRGDFAPQRYPTQSPARQPEASPNTSMSSASTKVHQNIYQKDYGRSQHDVPTTTNSTTAMSEPGTSEERYAAYLSRVATFDPRITKETKSSSSSRQGVYSNRTFPTSSNQSDSSTFSKHGIMEKKDSFLSKASIPSQNTSAAVAPSVTSSTNTVDRLQENRDSAPNRYRADRRTRLEKLSSSMHSRARSASRSITPTNREARGRSGGVTAPAAAAVTTINKQVAWKSVETQGQHQAQQHAQHSELTVETAPAPASPTADQMEQQRAVIETPSPAKVEELKRQLWSDDEQLKNWSHVSGEKILQAGKSHQRRHKSLSPDRPQYRKHLRSERVATAYGGSGGGGGSSSDNEGAPRVSSYYQQHSHSQHNRPSSNSGAVQDGSSPNRVFRSRFYAAAIAAHRGKEQAIQPTPSKELSTTKSAATTSHRGLEIARSNSTHSFNPTYTQPAKGAIPATSPHISLQPTTSKHHQQQQKQDMWRQAPSSAAAPAPAARNQAESIPITQSSSTATSDNYVAKLVAKLNAVRRDNPSAALAQIDAILRAESQSSSGDRQERADQEVGALNQPVPPAQRGFEQEEESDEEDETTSSEEDETTVSSITNPTFQSLRHNNDQADAARALVPHPSLHSLPKAHVAEVNGYATPYTMQQQQQPRHPWEAPNEKALKPKKIKGTPPPSIRVTSPRETSNEQPDSETTNIEESVAARRLDRYMQHQQTSPVDPNNPAELAEKIRMWDEMSNPSVTQAQSREYQMSSGTIEGQTQPLEEVLSNATEDLGSIVTPADQTSHTTFSGSKLTGGHPWDVHHPIVRASAGAVMIKDTSMLDGEGIETQPPRIQQKWRNQPATPANQAPTRQDVMPSSDAVESPAFFDVDERNRSSHASSQGDDSFGNNRRQRDTWNFSTSASQGRQVNTTSLSDEFDNAWVSLPPNAFFGRKGGPRLSGSPDEKADLLATTMFPGTASTATKGNRWQQQQQQQLKNLQQQKPSLLPPAVTAAFDQVSLNTETVQPRSHGANITATQHRSQKPESARRHEPSIPPMLNDPWLHSKNMDASGESQLSAGIEVSLLETPAPVSTSQAPATPKPNKSRLNFLRPILSRGRAQPATRSDVGEGVAYGSLTPKQQILRNAQASNTKSPQRDIAFSPPRGRSNSFEEMGRTATGSTPKNKTLANKFSRLMKVYDDKPGF